MWHVPGYIVHASSENSSSLSNIYETLPVINIDDMMNEEVSARNINVFLFQYPYPYIRKVLFSCFFPPISSSRSMYIYMEDSVIRTRRCSQILC